MEMKMTINTSIIGQKIYQSLQEEVDSVKNHLITWVTDTKEKSIRNALISLGWTPPKEEK